MNIQDFSPKNREKMVQRILESKQQKWQISDYDTKEKAETKLRELKDIVAAKTDDMPSMWCENVNGHIKELEDLLASGKLNESRKTYYWTCPDCGANLDPGEKCDCKNNKKEIVKNLIKESRLPKDDRDPQYGIPEQNKYPLYDREHVESAIRLFGHVEPRFEEKLARAIIAKMKKYGMSYKMIGKDNRLYKYVPEKMMNESIDVNFIIEQEENTEPSREIKHDLASTEILNNLRSDIQDELTAVKNYDIHADEAESNGLEDVAKVLRDIRDEEKVHIGELSAVLSKYDAEFSKSVAEGEKEVKNELLESVLDPIHKTRPIEIFDGDVMKSDVREFILNLLNNFKENSGLDFNFKKIYMIGSSTGFQYSETADIDIDVEVDKPNTYFEGKFSLLPKGVLLSNTQKPINIFLMFNDEETERTIKYAENCYDLIENKFIKVGKIEKQEVPLQYVSGLSSFLMNGIDVLFGEFERNKRDLEKIIKLNPNEVEISEKERDEAISKKIEDIQKNADSMKLAHHFLFVFNNEGYTDSPFKVRINYKFDDPHYSMNSLVYKYIDSFGYLEKMVEFEKEANEIIKKAKNEINRNFNNPTNEVEQKEKVESEIRD